MEVEIIRKLYSKITCLHVFNFDPLLAIPVAGAASIFLKSRFSLV